MRKTLVLLFGGQSTEHEVSCRSVLTIKRAVNQEKYKVLCYRYYRNPGNGFRWRKKKPLKTEAGRESAERAMILPDAKAFLPCFFWGKNGESHLEKN